MDQLNCGYMQTSFCDVADISILFLVPFLLTINVLSIIALIVHRRRIYSFTKNVLEYRNNKSKRSLQSIVHFADEDEEFTFKNLLPGLRQNYPEINVKPMSESMKCKWKYMKGFAKPYKYRDNVLKIVVFSPHYLTRAYRTINIRQIREAMRTKNTVYVFAEIDPENSVYAYLKEQRDPSVSVVWEEPNFWNSFVKVIRDAETKMAEHNKYAKFGIAHQFSADEVDETFSNTRKGPFLRIPDSPCQTGLNTLDHSQV